MSTEQIKLVYLNEGSASPEVKIVDKDIHVLQGLVQGLIQPIDLEDYDVDNRIANMTMYVNEEFLLHDFIPNVSINDELIILGPVFIVANSEDYDLASIPDDRISDVIDYLKDHKINLSSYCY